MRAKRAWLAAIPVGLAGVTAMAATPLEDCYQTSADRKQVRACLDARVAAAEDALADAYRAMRNEMERLDRVLGKPVGAPAFEASQQAFRTYRDKHCAWLAGKAVGGTGAGDIVRDCRIRLAQQRTQELREQMPTVPAGHPEEQAAPGVAAAVVGAWNLERMEVDGQIAELAPQPRVSLRVAQDGRVTGMASVNRYFGGAVFEAGGRVSWTGSMASTQMAGPEPLMAQEQRYLAALARTSRWQAQGDGLVLSSEDGAVKLSFAR